MHEPYHFVEAWLWPVRFSNGWLETIDGFPYHRLDFAAPTFGPPPIVPSKEALDELARILVSAQDKCIVRVSDTWSAVYLGREMIEELKALSKAPDPADTIDTLCGIPIIQVDDRQDRRAQAISHAFTTGRPVAYVDDDGNLFVAKMPEPSPIFPKYPFAHTKLE